MIRPNPTAFLWNQKARLQILATQPEISRRESDMNIGKFAAAAVIAVTGVLASAAGAFAYDAAATAPLNVRTGPGTDYPVIAALSRNQVVEVGQCTRSGSWCQVSATNIRGWASANYLRRIEPVPPRPSPGDGRPDVGFSISTPNINITIGTGRPDDDDDRYGRVCFYEDYDYDGRSFCSTEDDRARDLGSFWNERIRSARIEGNATATVCTGPNFTGRCGVIDRSVRNFGALSNEISSYYLD